MSLPPMMSTTWIVTIRDEFHGTALSAPNHLSRENQGEQRAAIQVNFSDKSVPELPYTYGQGSQKLYNWPTILSPPHYRNGVHHTVEIRPICLYCGELRNVSENI